MKKTRHNHRDEGAGCCVGGSGPMGDEAVRSQEEQLQFEEVDSAVMELGLYRDGVVLGRRADK